MKSCTFLAGESKLNTYVGITDTDWFTFLSGFSGIDEVNFWQPGGNRLFRTLKPGEPFLFKLHSPYDYIVGGGFFAHSTLLPCSLAWAVFAERNGAASIAEMRRRIERYRRTAPAKEDYYIGCILLEQPFFLDRHNWIQAPEDWSNNIVQGKRYDLTSGIGKGIWNQVQERFLSKTTLERDVGIIPDQARYGTPQMVLPRLGQGSFRVMVTDAYQRRCAVTQERTLPALEASHIRPYSASGPHNVKNGILLRSDIHRLFDNGYVTVTTDLRFEVSKRIKEEFENGRDYYDLSGKRIDVPENYIFQPAIQFLTWHNENVYLG